MLLANLGLFFTVIAWGSTAPVLNELLKTWDPVVLTAARFVLSSSVFLVWLKLAEGRLGWVGGIPWREVAILSIILTVFTMLLTYAIRFSNPINVSIIAAAGPVAASLIDRMLTGRNPPRAVMMALPLAVFGGIFASVDIDAIGSGGGFLKIEGGEIIMIAAVFLWPLYSALLQRWFSGMSQLRRTTLTFAGATPMLVIAAGILVLSGVESIPPAIPGIDNLALLAWTSLATSILGTYLWNVSVGKLGIVVATMFLNLIPMVAILVSMMFGIEPRMEQMVGGVLVIAAVVQAQVRSYFGPKRA